MIAKDSQAELRAGVEGIERSIEQKAASKGARKAATTAIVTAQAEALTAITRLDPIMHNLLRDNQPVKTVWDAARRVEKASALKKPAEKEETFSHSPSPRSSPAVSSTSATTA